MPVAKRHYEQEGTTAWVIQLKMVHRAIQDNLFKIQPYELLMGISYLQSISHALFPSPSFPTLSSYYLMGNRSSL